MSIEPSSFSQAFQVSPILLAGGLASNIPGGLLPISAILNPIALAAGLLAGGFQNSSVSLSGVDVPANLGTFVVAPGGTLLENDVGLYPFANQSVAANAVIFQPLRVSLLLRAPANQPGGYSAKISTFTAFQASLSQHSNSGGTYTVATPAFLYQNCLLLSFRDVSGDETLQVQYDWQLDFLQPLVTQAQAAQAYNTLTQNMTNQTQIIGDPVPLSGTSGTQGSPFSGVGQGLIPSIPPQALGLIGGNSFISNPAGSVPGGL